MKTIKDVLIERDGLTEKEADDLIQEAKSALDGYFADYDFYSAENICKEYFGLEEDYMIELMEE